MCWRCPKKSWAMTRFGMGGLYPFWEESKKKNLCKRGMSYSMRMNTTVRRWLSSHVYIHIRVILQSCNQSQTQFLSTLHSFNLGLSFCITCKNPNKICVNYESWVIEQVKFTKRWTMANFSNNIGINFCWGKKRAQQMTIAEQIHTHTPTHPSCSHIQRIIKLVRHSTLPLEPNISR